MTKSKKKKNTFYFLIEEDSSMGVGQTPKNEIL